MFLDDIISKHNKSELAYEIYDMPPKDPQEEPNILDYQKNLLALTNSAKPKANWNSNIYTAIE